MTYERTYKGLTIQIEGYWSESAQSNLYRWRVTHNRRVVNLEGQRSFTDFNEAYYDACARVDEF